MTYNKSAKSAEHWLPPRRRLIDMPIYEFECKSCNLKTETRDYFEFGPECTGCGKNMTRVWSSVAVHFKGSGFYKTDNR